MATIADTMTDDIDIWTSAIQRWSSGGRGKPRKVSLYGIEKLRELIFDLAALGKLVPAEQDCTFELGKHVELVMGQAPPGNTCNKVGQGTVFVKTGEFGALYPEVCEWTTKPLKLAREGDVLICVVGATIGKLNLAIDCAIGRSVAAIRPNQSLTTKFLYYSLMPVTLRLRRRARGSAQGVIGKAELNAIRLRIPAIQEQNEIVAKVDELLAICDQLEAGTYNSIGAHEVLVTSLLTSLTNSKKSTDHAESWKRIETHFDTLFTTEETVDQLKQTILQLAIMGKLVPQDPNDEPAEELLAQVNATRTKAAGQGKARKPKRKASKGVKAGPFALPSGWEWATFPELGIFDRGTSKHRPRNDPRLFEPGIYPVVQTGEVARADEYISEIHSEYSEFGLAQSRLWPKGTLCITIAANIGDTAILSFDACFPDSVVGFIPFEPITSPRYFLHFMKTAKADLLRYAPSTAQKNINLGILESVRIPIPPLKEMNRIVQKVDKLISLCNKLKTQTAKAQAEKVLFADAITSKAFA